jgi:hypothetical protein
MLIPDIQLGIVVLTNQEAGGAFSAIGHRIADRYLGAPGIDWITAYHKLDEKQRADAAEKIAKQRDRNADSNLPSRGEIRGRYRDPWYGEITIAMGATRCAFQPYSGWSPIWSTGGTTSRALRAAVSTRMPS